MVMILEGRQLPDETPKGRHCPTGRCVFCGKTVRHINDGGNAWAAGAILNGKEELFLYCNEDCGDPADKKKLWYCGLCDVDCLGKECHGCRRPRREVTGRYRGPYVLASYYKEIPTPEGATLEEWTHNAGSRGETYRYIFKFRSGRDAKRWAKASGVTTARWYEIEPLSETMHSASDAEIGKF